MMGYGDFPLSIDIQNSCHGSKIGVASIHPPDVLDNVSDLLCIPMSIYYL